MTIPCNIYLDEQVLLLFHRRVFRSVCTPIFINAISSILNLQTIFSKKHRSTFLLVS